jgi:hypothetical protein
MNGDMEDFLMLLKTRKVSFSFNCMWGMDGESQTFDSVIFRGFSAIKLKWSQDSL